MKTIVMTFVLWSTCALTFAQGLVNFFNNSTSLVSSGGPACPAFGCAISGAPGSYYFGLLVAPGGTADPGLFTFSGLYATNQQVIGRFFGGNGVSVPGWSAGSSESFEIAGWSASLGHDWNPAWLHGGFSAAGVWGLSGIGTGIAGGSTSSGTIPPLNVFGGVGGLQNGWNLAAVPEPSSLELWALSALTLLVYWQTRTGKLRIR